MIRSGGRASVTTAASPRKSVNRGSRSRHTANRTPLPGAETGDRDGLGIDHSGRDTEDRATRLEVRV